MEVRERTSSNLLPWLVPQVPALLAKAEELFGPRVPGWSFGGICFHSDGPHLFYPLGREVMVVQIALSNEAQNDPDRAVFQLSHEVVHLLSPGFEPPATMLEEGMATQFSLDVPRYFGSDYRAKSYKHIMTEPDAMNYRDALLLYDQLRAIDSRAAKKIREIEPNLKKVTSGLILTRFENVTASLAAALCDTRRMRR